MARLAIVLVLMIPAISKGRESSGAAYWASANFIVYSGTERASAKEFAARCETLRSKLQAKWLAETSTHAWRPQCVIVLHATAASYAQAVGRGAASTSGSSLVNFDKGAVTARRIDLRADQRERAASALAHEMTHLVLADRFRDQPPAALGR